MLNFFIKLKQFLIDRTESVSSVEKKINYIFHNKDYIRQAFTHKSLDTSPRKNYERLEFLGDAVLDIIVSRELMREFPEGDEGFLANNSKTGSYNLGASDDQKLINTNSTVTVQPNVFSAPAAVTIVNNSSSNISINQAGGVTMYLAGTSNTGNRTLAQKGIATVVCISSNNFIISGGGLS